MPVVKLFAQAREAAGTAECWSDAATVGDVMVELGSLLGPHFTDVARISGVWVNGEPAIADTPVGPADELAVIPPVSGG